MADKIKSFFTKENLKGLVTGKTLSAIMSIVAAGLSLVLIILDAIYTGKYTQYQDSAVIWFLVIAIVFWVAYFLIKDNQITNWFCFIGVLFAGLALALFLANSINVWQDVGGSLIQNGELFGTFNFFNSEGGPIFPAIIIIIFIITEICGIISCFTGKTKKDKVELVDGTED